MAPELADKKIFSLPEGSRILDPMCGSGTTLFRSLKAGHNAYGWDIDPLAVKMSRARCRRYNASKLRSSFATLLNEIKVSKLSILRFAGCRETKEFANYWFADEQKNDLNKISLAIDKTFPRGRYRDFFQIALSRIIITKFKGASLGWDISHSRPHKKKTKNIFNTELEFEKSVIKLINLVENEPCSKDATIALADCRTAKSDIIFDAIITSPPYLNAIDYMRGHKFSLIWMGYTIPELREIRRASIGSENKRFGLEQDEQLSKIAKEVCSGKKINSRTFGILLKYIDDCNSLISSLSENLSRKGALIFVIANSVQYGTRIQNDKILKTLAQNKGFYLEEKTVRRIPQHSRYLPVTGSNSITNRIKTETVLHFSKA